MDDSDRRTHPRIDFRHRGEALIQQHLDIEIVNLSVGGMGFKSSLPIEPGSLCNLVLFQGNVSVESRVVSCARVPRRKQKYRVGVQFTKVSSQMLDEVIEMEEHFRAREARIRLEVDVQPNFAVIYLPSEMSDLDNADMARTVQNFLDDGSRKFIVDLENVGDISDVTFEGLLEIDDEVKFEAGTMMLTNCSSNILTKLTVSQMASSIPIFESVAKAIQELEKVKGNQKTETLAHNS